MSLVMTDLSDDDAIAAEFVLRTLDESEYHAADTRRKTDAAFAALIHDWDVRFAPLAAAGLSVTPPTSILSELLNRLSPTFSLSNDAEQSNVITLQRKIRVWRSVAILAGSLAAAMALWIGQDVVRQGAVPQSYVAVLQQGADAPAFVVSVDLKQHRMAVMPLKAAEQAGKSYELWMIGDAQGVPRSLGLVDPKSMAHPVLPAVSSDMISKATYAVTLEPLGGSPTGQPTSAPLFTGRLIDVPK